MDKRITTPQGILKSEKKTDKKPSQNLQNKKERKEKFEINENEFPSLNEISNKFTNGKNPMEYKPSSYSEKLKKIPKKSKSSSKFESAHDSPKNEFFFVKEEISMGTPKKSLSPSLPSQSVNSGFVAHPNSSEATKPQMNKSDERKAPTRLSPNNKFSFGVKDVSECKANSSLERSKGTKNLSKKTDNLPDGGKAQYFRPFSKAGDAKASERKSTAKSSLHKENSSASKSDHAIRQERNSSKHQDKKAADPEQDSLAVDGKKKKKRKSKVKRQAALQSGKILVLTPELHSRILNQSNVNNSKHNPYVVTNINDSEEYPELGSSVKTSKENTTVKSSEPTSKDGTHPENELRTKQNEFNSTLPNSSSDSDVVQKDKGVLGKPQDKEKAPVLLKDPISVSIFDMLQNAMSKKKDIAKKGDTSSLESPMGNANPLPRVIGKKGVLSAVNPLDASRPTIKRGKEREKPKVKKPSRMRKLILIGRQLRKEEMENCEDAENTDAAYTSLSDECLSPSKFSRPDESSFVQSSESDPKSSSSSDEDKVKIEANVISSLNYIFVPNAYVMPNSVCKIPEETESNVGFPTGSEKGVDLNMLGDLTEFVELTPDVEELKNISLKSSYELKLSSIEQLDHEAIESGDQHTNRGESPSLMQTKYSNDSTKENKSELDLSSINTEISDSMPQNIPTLDSQESDHKTTDSFVHEISCDNLQMIENSSNQLMNLMKNVTLKPKVTDELKTEAVKTLIHTRKFRKYCNHFVCKAIDEVVFALLDDLARFQDRMHQKDPVKARIRKRLLYGIKEIKRHMKLKKLKGIILATDIEDIKTEGGLNDVVNEIITLAEACHIPYIFSHRRFNLGKVCRKGVPVSCVGIFNYEGSEKNFKRILELQEESKLDYLAVSNALGEVLSCDEVADVLRLGKGVPEKLQEMRTSLLKGHFKLEATQHKLESIKTIKDSNYNESLKESKSFEIEKIDNYKIHNILFKYNLL